MIDHLGAIANRDRITDFDQLCKEDASFAALPLSTGSHTLIWAASLGYKSIYVLGVDCNYVEIVPGAEQREKQMLEITSEGSNPNYFFAGYQRVGDKYNLPNTSPDLHIKSWRAAGAQAARQGATVLNIESGVKG